MEDKVLRPHVHSRYFHDDHEMNEKMEKNAESCAFVIIIKKNESLLASFADRLDSLVDCLTA